MDLGPDPENTYYVTIFTYVSILTQFNTQSYSSAYMSIELVFLSFSFQKMRSQQS